MRGTAPYWRSHTHASGFVVRYGLADAAEVGVAWTVVVRILLQMSLDLSTDKLLVAIDSFHYGSDEWEGPV